MKYNKEQITYFSIILLITIVVPIIAYFNMARYIENFTLLHLVMPLIIGFISSFGLANFYLLRITNKKLVKSENEYKQIVDNISGRFGVYKHTGLDGVIIYASEGVKKLLGIEPEMIIGKPWMKIVNWTPEVLNEAQKNIDQMIENPNTTFENELQFIDENGLLRTWMTLEYATVDSSGKLISVNGLLADVTEKKLYEEELKKHAFFDKLTGLRNRMSLYDSIDNMIVQSKRKNSLNALVFMDLDGFKTVNDTYGHEAGDYILVTVSERIQKLLRESDTIARLGGDEFVLLLTNLSSKSEVEPIVNKLIRIIEKPIFFKEIKLEISTSAGVSFYPDDEMADGDELMRRADKAMYKAKMKGKGRYEFYT